MSTNQIPRFGSQLRAEKVLAPRNARTVPLIKLIEISIAFFFLKYYFSQLR